ncbi:MAG: maleylpyruvate isomerase family mycothiol-dependent enzyme [Acidimicrobiia bacterium]
MALPRAEVSDGLLSEMEAFEALIRPLTAAEWDTPSRCDEWTVGDVARHAIGSMTDVVEGRLDGLGTPAVTQREVDERAGRSAEQLADECAETAKAATGMLPMFDDDAWAAPAPGGYDGTLGDGVEALWYDFWLHGDDVRAALGKPSVLGTGLRGGVSHVAGIARTFGWKGDVPANDDAAFAFVLAATGRGTPQPDVPRIYA